jgi:hypothetical protein
MSRWRWAGSSLGGRTRPSRWHRRRRARTLHLGHLRRAAGRIAGGSRCASFRATSDPAAAVTECASGRELAAGGFGDDVAIAVEIDASSTVPVLAGGAFTAAENAVDPVGRVEP